MSSAVIKFILSLPDDISPGYNILRDTRIIYWSGEKEYRENYFPGGAGDSNTRLYSIYHPGDSNTRLYIVYITRR